MAKLLEIVTHPDSRLKKKSEAITDVNSEQVRQLIPDLVLAMQEKDGLGIAAPQVGVNIRLVIINTEEGPLALINPEITSWSKKKEIGEEGCLSIPGVWGLVKRYKKVKVRALTHTGEQTKFSAEDMFARVIQHEIDHLDGILFIDRAKKVVQGESASAL